LGVNAWNEPKTQVKQFVDSSKLKHRILLDGAAVAEQYNVGGLPATCWINSKGTIVDCEVGFGGAAALEQKTKRLLLTSP